MFYTLWLVFSFKFGMLWLILESLFSCFVVLIPMVHILKAPTSVSLVVWVCSIDLLTLCRNIRLHRQLQTRVARVLLPDELLDVDAVTAGLSK